MNDCSGLTARQREILRLVWQRFQIKEIAQQLRISPDVVKQHLAAARERLGGAPTSMAAARILAEHEGLSTSPVGGPPASEVPATTVSPAQRVTTADAIKTVLRDDEAPTAYIPHHVSLRLPLPTSVRRSNDLTWRGKLLWGLVIAFVSVALVGAFKALFH